jgi:hypothetical protein
LLLLFVRRIVKSEIVAGVQAAGRRSLITK